MDMLVIGIEKAKRSMEGRLHALKMSFLLVR